VCGEHFPNIVYNIERKR